ncbi:MAG: DUF169 domain-containing protein [Chloroherpetonaceae bacterium]|nr:DUF169 domain-containing protein [Chloroherpetonaceae bacterium]
MIIDSTYHATSETGEKIDTQKFLAVMKQFKLKHNPVAITYCRETPPEGYSPLADVPCSLVHHADIGKKVYINANNHDCKVGLYHLGMLENPPEYITEGIYMTDVQQFYTVDAARSNKHNTINLPQGEFKALAAAPLDQVEDETLIHSIIVICEPQYAMILAGAASTRIGKFPIGELGMSACASIFSMPYLENNSMFVVGDGGGRIHNKLTTGEMFAIIPRDHIKHLFDVADSFKITPGEMRKRIRPSYFVNGVESPVYAAPKVSAPTARV